MNYTFQNRFNKYKTMWILVAFDMPTETKVDRKRVTKFRKYLLDDGFKMFQYSIYVRHCASRENMQVHIKRVRKHLPPNGKVSILRFTDAQFGKTINFYGRKKKDPINVPQQLTLF